MLLLWVKELEVLEDAHERLKYLAQLLGWRNLREHRYVVDRDVPHLQKGQVIRFWYAGSYDDVAFQINENPPWYACVYAMRYRICTGWHRFTLHRNQSRLESEARRLREFMNCSWFAMTAKRREFRSLHPECANYTWRRLREEGPPYYYHGLRKPTLGKP